MPHTVIYNPEEHIIEWKVQGSFALAEVKEIAYEIAIIAKEKGCFCGLGDFLEAKANLTTLEIYELPKILLEIYASAGVDRRKFKEATVMVNDLKDFTFFETVTANQMQNQKVFQNIDEAKKWLSKK